jgi:hypothetical protein
VERRWPSAPGGSFLATVLDLPEARTYGDVKAEALARVVDAIRTVVDECIRTRLSDSTMTAASTATSRFQRSRCEGRA